ncbi:hypothetical protein HDU93_009771 [Gonapodya sp. JEL0774]|nr:hypothetical protein HDU93_009771 [Gonapodya sp. JEL0774]
MFTVGLSRPCERCAKVISRAGDVVKRVVWFEGGEWREDKAGEVVKGAKMSSGDAYRRRGTDTVGPGDVGSWGSGAGGGGLALSSSTSTSTSASACTSSGSGSGSTDEEELAEREARRVKAEKREAWRKMRKEEKRRGWKVG